MSNTPEEPQSGIGDDQLPDDLLPGEDNPLAEGLEPGETVDDLMEGKQADESAGDGPAEDDTGGGDESDTG